ncbi:MAG: hypothetical protein BWX70_02038 [Verrucomicrobia bacterium ADurb.Bin070]|nr:MAG: hypothetical protein BWX70_02038 [Verrucomicrobia bacterium ADurb.Bin070]
MVQSAGFHAYVGIQIKIIRTALCEQRHEQTVRPHPDEQRRFIRQTGIQPQQGHRRGRIPFAPFNVRKTLHTKREGQRARLNAAEPDRRLAGRRRRAQRRGHESDVSPHRSQNVTLFHEPSLPTVNTSAGQNPRKTICTPLSFVCTEIAYRRAEKGDRETVHVHSEGVHAHVYEETKRHTVRERGRLGPTKG